MDRKIKAQIVKLEKDIRDEKLRLKKEIFDLDYEYFLVSKETLDEKLEKLDALDAKKSMLEEKLGRVKVFSAEYANLEAQYCIYCCAERSQLVLLEGRILQSKLKGLSACGKCIREIPASICAASTTKN